MKSAKKSKGKSKSIARSSSGHRSAGRRLTHEQQQEYVSLDQCSARFSTYGWIRNELKRDHGEDISIQIYEKGNATGLSFYLQVKSTTSVENLRLKHKPTVASYTLEVGDLEHWNKFGSAVVLVIWDVNRQEGIWHLVSDLIQDLQRRTPKWRRQREVAIHIPVDNRTNDNGLARLRGAIAGHYLPIYCKMNNNEVTISTELMFPNTEQGAQTLREFETFLDTGKPVTIDGKFVKNVQMSDWWERIFGRDEKVTSISMGPATSHVSLPCRLELDTHRFPLPVTIPYLDLKLVRGGRKEVLVSNEHQKIPVHVRLTFLLPDVGNTIRCRLGFTIQYALPNIYDALEATRFALGQKSGYRIRLIDCATGRTIVEAPLNEVTQTSDFLERWFDALGKLCFLQRQIARFGTVKLPQKWIRLEDEVAIKRLYDICTKGEEHSTLSQLKFSVSPSTIDRKHIENTMAAFERDPTNEQYHVKFVTPADESLRIASVNVPLGRTEVTILDSLQVCKEMLLAADSTEQDYILRFKKLRVIKRYLDWLPGGQYVQSSNELQFEHNAARLDVEGQNRSS